jgi:O-antigen/teichoic acid export membrane protein
VNASVSLDRQSDHPYAIARLRRSALLFVASKGLTAPLNLVTFFLIAARLPTDQFALYAWLIAVGQLSHQLSFLGLNWAALHYVPLYRSRIGGPAYRRFLLVLVALRVIVVTALVAALFFVAPLLVAIAAHDSWQPALRLFLLVMAAELMVEFIRPCLFETLLEQGLSQVNVLIQHVVFLAGLLFALALDGSTLSIGVVIVARAVALWVALLAALAQLAHVLRQPTAAAAGDREPGVPVLVRFALDNYAQDVLRLTASGQLMTMVASRVLDVSGLAAFGFAQHLTGIVDRLLPGQLFLGLWRPRVIAAYGEDRSFTELHRRIALILKVTISVLAAVAAVLIAIGPSALALLAGGRYAATQGLLLAFLLWLAILSAQSMQSVLANVLGRSELLRRASVSSLLAVPAAVALARAGAGAYGLVVGMIVGAVVCVWMVSNQLSRAGYPLTFDAHGYGRLAATTAAAALLGKLVDLSFPPRLWSVTAGVIVTLAAFPIVLRLLRTFAPAERRAMETLLGRKLVLP